MIDMYRSGVCGDYRFVYERFPPTADALLQELAAGSSRTEHLVPHQLGTAGEEDFCKLMSTHDLNHGPGHDAIPRLSTPIMPILCYAC